jgi:hypothetical protein
MLNGVKWRSCAVYMGAGRPTARGVLVTCPGESQRGWVGWKGGGSRTWRQAKFGLRWRAAWTEWRGGKVYENGVGTAPDRPEEEGGDECGR